MARKQKQPMTFFSIHFNGAPPYSDGDFIDIDGGYKTQAAAMKSAGQSDLIVQWERKAAWRVKKVKPELVPE